MRIVAPGSGRPWSVKNSRTALASEAALDLATDCLDWPIRCSSRGAITAAITPRITTITITSMIVKARRARRADEELTICIDVMSQPPDQILELQHREQDRHHDKPHHARHHDHHQRRKGGGE